jgi:hypothetical protein
MASATELFTLLDTCVAADSGPPGFKATLGFGVLGETRVEWWVGKFDGRAFTSRPTKTPEGCDTVLLLGLEEVRALLSGRPASLRARRLEVMGDPRNLLRFKERYLKRNNLVRIRLGGAS